MTKEDISLRVLRDGEPVAKDLYTWDEDKQLLSTFESGLFFDFACKRGITFRTVGI